MKGQGAKRRLGRRAALLAVLCLAAGAAAASFLVASAGARSTATPPLNATLPAITGIRVGETLSVDTGVWSSDYTISSYEYQWVRVLSPSNWVPIPGATKRTYTLGPDDVGHQVFVQIKVVNQIGPNWANSPWTPLIVDPTLTGRTKLASGETSIPVGSVVLPDRLKIAVVSFSSAAMKAGSAVTVRVRVLDSNNYAVSGVSMSVKPVPFGAVAAVPAQATGSDGYAEFQVGPAVKGKLAKGQWLALFLEATAPGGDPLMGISASRLAAIRVG